MIAARKASQYVIVIEDFRSSEKKGEVNSSILFRGGGAKQYRRAKRDPASPNTFWVKMTPWRLGVATSYCDGAFNSPLDD